MATEYAYSPLPSGADDIRLLTLQPGNKADNLEIIIQHCSLVTAAGQYDALSYVWGSTDNPVTITVRSALLTEDSSLSVTQNLAVALKHLCSSNTPRTIWIDAICIDQKNMQERSEQVLRMNDIYRMATRVVRQSEPHWADVNEALPWGKTEVRAIKRLVDRQWFERLWVLQEALANPNTLVLCGTSETTWETLFGSILGLVSKKSAMGWTQRRLSRIFSIVDAFYTARSPGLIRAVHRARTLKCADPRDKVYAVLGIASNSQQVKPDYTLSEYQVYRQLATAQIENGDLDFLSYCDLDSREVAGPTWVPDWSSEWTTQLMVWNNAAGFASAPITEHLDQGLIKVAAVRAGTLCKVDEVCLPSSDTSTIAAEVARLAPAHVESLPYKTGCSLLEAFSGTLATLDLNMSGGNVTFFPTLHASIDTVRSYLRCAEGTPLIDSIEDRTYRGYLWQGTTDRAFVSTDEGYIGLAPESAREGDVVYAILSCRSLIVLRPVEGFENRFQVVGVCFLYGLNHGEAILGSLPGHVRGEYHFDREADVWRDVYRNVDTDEISLEDPRLLALGIHPGLGANSLPNRVSGETLEKAGVGIDRIELV